METIKAREGFWLTNGDLFVKEVAIFNAADRDKWAEVSEEHRLSVVRSTVEQLENDMQRLKQTFIEDLLERYAYDIKSATEYKEIKDRYDELNKVIQTTDGTGTMQDPIKGWMVGMDVESGKWYLTDDGYLWEAINDGKPTSSTDREYFDVVGL